MKKRLLCVIMSVILTMGLSTAASFAAVGGESAGDGSDATITPYSTASVSFVCKRLSNTKARVETSVQFTSWPTSYNVTVTLQKKSSGSWVVASDISGYNHVYRGYDDSSVLTGDTWTVKSGVVYRVKVVSVDHYPSNSYSRTSYSDPF